MNIISFCLPRKSMPTSDLVSFYRDTFEYMSTPVTIFLLRLLIFAAVAAVNIVLDIKKKEVYPYMLIAAAVSVVIINALIDLNIFFSSVAGCLIVAFLFGIIYFASRKKGIGLGDMLFFLFVTSLFGHVIGLLAFLFSFWTATIVLIPGLAAKKLTLKSRIPLIPFITAGTVLALAPGIVMLLASSF